MVSENKQKIVLGLVKDIKEHPVVGVLNLENLPAQQLQKMRSTLAKNNVKIVMTRKKLIRKALEKSAHSNVMDLSEKLVGMPALLFATSNPFSLYRILQKNKSEAPAKPGQTAPKDIVVRAGQTNFAPGPIISELASAGIKTKVEAGKLAIIADTTVAKEGDKISFKLAETLKRLDIKPMEIGLDLIAVWENGTIFLSKQLDVNEEKYLQDFVQAVQWAFNLSVYSAYPTSDTIGLLLGKAFREAKSLSLESSFMTDLTSEEIIAKAERQALSLKGELGELPEAAVKIHPKKAEDDDSADKPAENSHKTISPKADKAHITEKRPHHEDHSHKDMADSSMTAADNQKFLVEEALGEKEVAEKNIAPVIPSDNHPEKNLQADKWDQVLHKMPSHPKSDLGSLKSEIKQDDLSRLADRSNSMPSAEHLIEEMKNKKFGKEAKTDTKKPSAEKLIEEEIFFAKLESERQKEISKGKLNKPNADKDVQKAENLYEELMK